MKIVDYETFIRMPAGTIFAPWRPCVFIEPFEIKVDCGKEYTYDNGEKIYCFNGTMPLDPWNVTDLFPGCDIEASFEVYDGDSTDARSHEWFCVLDRNDIMKLINALYWSMDGCPGELENYGKYRVPSLNNIPIAKEIMEEAERRVTNNKEN